MIIGLSGFARSGKDEVAKVLVEQHGFKRVAFADILRDVLYALNPDIGGYDGIEYLQDVIDDYGWDHYKETHYSDEIRRLLQRLGTEAGRDTLGQNIWVDAVLKDYTPEQDWVVSDARFINEFDAITDRGGKIIRVMRPGVEAFNDHASETEALTYTNFAGHINNNGTLEELAEKVRKIL